MKFENIGDVIELKKITEETKKIEKEKRFIIWCYLVFSMFVLFFLLYLNSWFYYYRPLTVDYTLLNSSWTEYAVNLTQSVRHEYLMASKKLTYTSDLSHLNGKRKEIESVSVGRNWIIKKEVVVFLTGNLEFDRDTLCHELLHSLIINANCEFYVSDLAKKEVCYDN